MDIDDLSFDNTNIRTLADHGINVDEVREIVDRNDWAVDTHPAYPDQIRVIGPTRTGRMLTIAMEPTDEASVWRPVTGWDSDARERRYHSEWVR